MSKTILRHQMSVEDSPKHITVRGDAKIIHCAEDRQGFGRIDIWVEIENDMRQPEHYICLMIFGTGYTIPNDVEHVQTVVMSDGFVWHIYKQ